MTTVKKISIAELDAYVNTVEFKAFKFIPISKNRVFSYINNPNAKPTDIVLYMAFKNKQMVAYRTVFADVFFVEDEKIRFAWFSGNWVHPLHRRQKLSTFLFNEIYKDWDGMLIFSNYADASKKLYDKTEKFKVFKTLNGYRHYFKFCLADILPAKKPIFNTLKPLLKALDGFGNIALKLRKKRNEMNGIDYQKIDFWDNSHAEFLHSFKTNELFKRTTQEYNWIKKYPWVKTDDISMTDSKIYEFSTYSRVFNSSFFAILKDNKIVAIVQLLVNNHHLKVPYIYTQKGNEKLVSSFILNIVNKHNISFATIYHPAINQLIIDSYIPIKNKMFSQGFLASKELLNKWTIKNKDVQSGDGDSVFC